MKERSFRKDERRKKHRKIGVICSVISGALIVLIIIFAVRSHSRKSSRTRVTPRSGHPDVGDNASEDMPHNRRESARQKPSSLKDASNSLNEQKEKNPDLEDKPVDKPVQRKDKVGKELKEKELNSGKERDDTPSKDKLENKPKKRENRHEEKKKEKIQSAEDKPKSQDRSEDPQKGNVRNSKENPQSKDSSEDKPNDKAGKDVEEKPKSKDDSSPKPKDQKGKSKDPEVKRKSEDKREDKADITKDKPSDKGQNSEEKPKEKADTDTVKDEDPESKEDNKTPKEEDSERRQVEDQETVAKRLLTGDLKTVAYTPLDPALVSYLSVEDLDSLLACIENFTKDATGLNPSRETRRWKTGVTMHNKQLIDLHKSVATDPSEQIKLWARTGFKLFKSEIFAQLLRERASDVGDLCLLIEALGNMNHSLAELAAKYPGITWEGYLELSLARFLIRALYPHSVNNTPVPSGLLNLCISFCRIYTDGDVEAMLAELAKYPSLKASAIDSLKCVKMTNVDANIFYKKLLSKLEI